MSRRGTREGSVVLKSRQQEVLQPGQQSLPRGGLAVMAQRREPPDSLDFFPTPPWATRALIEQVLKAGGETLADKSVWEPAAGAGHMTEVLREAFGQVHASDVFDYGRGYALGSFTGAGPDVARCPFVPDWIITNPPFNGAEAFVARATREARRGVAVLVRTAWLESVGRYHSTFQRQPPATVALFVERVPMVKGRWDPEASTATSYCWVIWDRAHAGPPRFTWIPPGCRERLTKASDRRVFAPETVPESGLF